MEKDGGCIRKEKGCNVIRRRRKKDIEQGVGMLNRWGYREDVALQVVQGCNVGNSMKYSRKPPEIYSCTLNMCTNNSREPI